MKQVIDALCAMYDEETKTMLPTDKPLRLVCGVSPFTSALAKKCVRLGVDYTYSDHYIKGYPTVVDVEIAKVPEDLTSKDDIDGIKRGRMPAVTEAVLALLRHRGLAGAHIVIVGRGHAVRGLADRLLEEDASVTVCHSKTKYLYDATTVGDAIVLATPASARLAVCTLDKNLIVDLGGVLNGRVILDNRYVSGAMLGKLTTSILLNRVVKYGNNKGSS